MDLVDEQQFPVLSWGGVQVVLGWRPAVLVAVVLQQADSRADLALLQGEQTDGRQGGAGQQGEHEALRVL